MIEPEVADCPASSERPGEGTVIGTAVRGDAVAQLRKYAANSCPPLGFEADIEDAVRHAGESCGLIDNIKPAAEIVCNFEQEAEAVARALWDTCSVQA